jgi:hypothetical protein
MVRDGLAALRAGRGDRLTHDKVKKKSEQMRKQGCDQNPENWPHIAPPSICKHEPETQKPDSEHDAEHKGSAAKCGHRPQHSTLVSGLVPRNQPDQ